VRHGADGHARGAGGSGLVCTSEESPSPALTLADRCVPPPLRQITKVLAAYVQAQLKAMNKVAAALQREEYKLIDIQ
jgi:hypothetical protein